MDSSIFLTNFAALDWIIVVVYLVVTVAKGVWVNRYVGDLSDFIVAGRELRIYLAIATMTGTEIGLVTVMYNAQEGFSAGLSAYVIGLCWLVGMLIVGLSGFVIYPLRKFEIMTIPEYYELRYGIRTRVVGGAILALAGILNMGLFLQAGARFMTGVLGIGTGVGLKVLMTVMLFLVLLYTTFGGMVSVVVTDYIQFVVLGSVMVVATVWAVTYLGWDNIVNTTVSQHGDAGINPLAADGYGIGYILWMVYLAIAGGALWATVTTRALAVHSPKTAQKLYAWSSITFLARVVIPVTWGAAAMTFIVSQPELSAAFLGDGPDKLNSQYAMPVFFARFFPSGFLGILAAGMMAGFMSTHDSYLLCWASVITQDVIAPLYRVSARGRAIAGGVSAALGGAAAAGIVSGAASLLGIPPVVGAMLAVLGAIPCALFLLRRVPRILEAPDLSERGRFIITRLTIVLIGVFLLVWGLWYEAPMTLWTYMAITGTIYLAGAFACIAFGLYWKRANETGALIALVAGLIACLGILPWASWGVAWINGTSASIAAIVAACVAIVVGSLLSKPRTGIRGTVEDQEA